jgi:transporter family protein
MWALWAILSALFLGFYDVCKKRSLSDNSVIGVLACSVLISAAMLAPALFTDIVPHVDAHGHLMIFIKSLLVLSSWLCGYIALKHLPISIVSPMQASRPMWTLVGALLIFHESLNAWQWAGIAVTLGTIFAFSFSIRHKDSAQRGQGYWYIFLVLAILLGACCGLYDKHIMRTFDRNAVQVYYTLYQAALMALTWLITTLLRKRNVNYQLSIINFSFRWSILGISVFLILSDYVYLKALSDPDSLIAVVSTIRRAGTIIPFLYGIIVLHEKQIRAKVLCLTGVILGLICLLIGTL